MKKAKEYYEDNKYVFGQDDCHGEVSYPDEEVERLIEIAYLEGILAEDRRHVNGSYDDVDIIYHKQMVIKLEERIKNLSV